MSNAHTQPALILASTSVARCRLLKTLGIPFEVAASGITETIRAGETAAELTLRLAIEKAKAVAINYPEHLIIGADQVGEYNNEIFAKPANHADAVRQLTTLSGNSIRYYTGLCLYNSHSQQQQTTVATFDVTYRHLTTEMIEHYLQREQPYACAGSLRIEGLGISLCQRLNGDDPNSLVGLPLIALIRMLEQERIAVL